MKTHAILLSAVLLGFLAVSCEKNDYSSKPPTFSGVSVTSLDDGSTTIKVGKRFVVEAQQKSYGRLLNKTTYTWAISPSNTDDTQKNKSVVIYDNDYSNPADTVVINTPGTYTFTLTASYNASGSTDDWNKSYGSYTDRWDDGSAAYSSRGVFGFQTVVTKKNVKVTE